MSERNKISNKTMQCDRALIILLQQINFERGNNKEPYFTLSWEDIDMLFYSMLNDMVDVFSGLMHVDLFLSGKSEEYQDGSLLSSNRKITLLDISATSLNEHIAASIDAVFEQGYRKLILLLHYYPLYTIKFIDDVFAQLSFEDDCLVYGALRSGNCCLLGLKTNYSNWFRNKNKENNLSSFKESGLDTDYLLREASNSDVIVFPVPTLKSVENGYDIARLKNEIVHSINVNSQFAKHTYEAFKYIEKKYTWRKPKDEAWDIRRHI